MKLTKGFTGNALVEYVLPLALILIAGGVIAAFTSIEGVLPQAVANAGNTDAGGGSIAYAPMGYGPNGAVSAAERLPLGLSCDQATQVCTDASGAVVDVSATDGGLEGILAYIDSQMADINANCEGDGCEALINYYDDLRDKAADVQQQYISMQATCGTGGCNPASLNYFFVDVDGILSDVADISSILPDQQQLYTQWIADAQNTANAFVEVADISNVNATAPAAGSDINGVTYDVSAIIGESADAADNFDNNNENRRGENTVGDDTQQSGVVIVGAGNNPGYGTGNQGVN